MSTPRTYAIVLLGATGYTGKLCAEHITKHLPTNLPWAVAGRSPEKLRAVVDDLKKLNPDRVQPAVLQVNLKKEDLDDLTRRTKILLNCVGPYHLYSTPVVAACAENGTHYFDVTGETPWVREMVQKYHGTAKTNRAILIPEIGIESAPSDVMGYMLASKIRKSLGCGTRNAVCSVHEVKGATISGGTLATVLGILDHYSLAEVRASSDPYSLSPKDKQAPKNPSERSLLSRALGPFIHPQLGTLTSSITSSANEAIVNRSSGLMPHLYGDNFTYKEYMRVSNYAMGILTHFALLVASLLLAVKPLRSLIRKFVYQPGQGPSTDASATANASFELRAIGTAEDGVQANPSGRTDKARQAEARFQYNGGVYHLTGVLLAEGAMVLLENPDLVDRLGGGLLTPACLGDKYVERLQAANVKLEANMMS